MLGFGPPEATPIGETTPAELRRSSFAAGSMAPKVEAACRFVERTGGRAAIGALEAAAISSNGARARRSHCLLAHEALTGCRDERHRLGEEHAHRVAERDRLRVGRALDLHLPERRGGQLDRGLQRQRRELLALRLLHRLRLLLGELAQRAEEILGITAAEREETSAALSIAERLRELDEVAGLDLALELRHRALGGLQRGREGRAPPRVELALEAARRGADLVEPRRRGELRRLAEHDAEARAAASASSIPSGASRTRRSARLAIRASRSPLRRCRRRPRRARRSTPRRASSRRLVTAEPSSRTPSQRAFRRRRRSSRGRHAGPVRARSARTPETTSPASACAAASSAARSSSSLSAMSPTIGGVPSVDARELFAPLGPSYDRVGAALSFGQDPLWRRFLVSRLPRDGGHVLDVATGTGLVAAELLRRGFRVTGVDQSAEMLARARQRFGDTRRARRSLGGALAVRRRGVRPPHVHVPPALRRRPGSDARRALTRRASRRNVVARSSSASRADSRVRRGSCTSAPGSRSPDARFADGWREVGDFLGDSIRSYWETYPIERQLELWSARASSDVEVRRLSLGGGVVMWGTRTSVSADPRARPSWYALEPEAGATTSPLLHLPYTAWHLSYVVIGGCLAPIVAWGRLGAAVAAFGLAVGIGAHALDELRGRPLRTRHPERQSSSAWRRLDRGRVRDRGRRGRDVRAVARTARPCRPLPRRRLQPRARSAAGSTRICGSGSPGAASRSCAAMPRSPAISASWRCLQPRSPFSSRSPSARSRTTCATCGATRRVGRRRARARGRLA